MNASCVMAPRSFGLRNRSVGKSRPHPSSNFSRPVRVRAAAKKYISPGELTVAKDLCSFIDRSPSPFHVCRNVAEILRAENFTELREGETWESTERRCFVVRGSSIAAWSLERTNPTSCSFRIVGAHTDSPGFRVKPLPNVGSNGYQQLGLDVYGGPILKTWFDRDLGLAGSVLVRDTSAPNGLKRLLYRSESALLRIPNLPIHFEREVNDTPTAVDKQKHTPAIFAQSSLNAKALQEFLAGQLGIKAEDIVSFDLTPFDMQPASIWGAQQEFISTARVDNLLSTFSAMHALIKVASKGGGNHIPLMISNNHEEFGSETEEGAKGSFLQDVLERIVGQCTDWSREAYHRAIANSVLFSSDATHALHPNQADTSEKDHAPQLNGGPAIKWNAQRRYATNDETEALMRLAAERANVPLQTFVNRSDKPCGSTIGPLTATRLGIRTADFGPPMWSMHSVRETTGTKDPGLLMRLMEELYQ